MSQPKDPGREAIAYCEARYSSMVDDFDFFERRKDELIAEALKDCTDAIIQTDEDTIIETLAKIGNRVHHVDRTGDLDDHLALIDEILATMAKLINEHAEAQAALDLDQRWGGRR